MNASVHMKENVKRHTKQFDPQFLLVKIIGGFSSLPDNLTFVTFPED